jgi:hypothetical protein
MGFSDAAEYSARVLHVTQITFCPSAAFYTECVIHSHMNRREILVSASAGLGGGLSGCLRGNIPASDDESETETPTSADASSGMRLSLTGVDDGLGPLAFDVDVVENLLTSSSVPLLDISVENTGNGTATLLYAPAVGEDEIVFPCQHATPDKLVVGFEAEVNRLTVDGEGCVRTETELDRGSSPLIAELAPGDALEQRYAIAGFAPNLNDACPPEESYRFDCPYQDYGRWGFEIELMFQEN